MLRIEVFPFVSAVCFAAGVGIESREIGDLVFGATAGSGIVAVGSEIFEQNTVTRLAASANCGRDT